MRKRVSDTHCGTRVRELFGDARYWWRYTVSDALVARRGLLVVIGCAAAMVALAVGVVYAVAASVSLPAAEPARAPGRMTVEVPVAAPVQVPTVITSTTARPGPKSTPARPRTAIPPPASGKELASTARRR